MIGNVLVYADAGHVITTFARTLASPLRPHLLEALAGAPGAVGTTGIVPTA